MFTERAIVSALGVALTLTIAGCSKGSEPPPSALTQAPPASNGAPASSGPSASRAPQAALTNLGPDLPPLPPGIMWAVRSPEIMRATYEFAARRPDVMRYIPCFCGCERGGHKDNSDCFIAGRDGQGRVTAWESHALGCEICVDVAYQTMQMHNSGASTSAIRDAVEKRYAAHTGGHTPTPVPSRKGG